MKRMNVISTKLHTLPADPWCESTYESQAFVRALQFYRQDKGCYESWEMLLGTEEKVRKQTHSAKFWKWVYVHLLINCLFMCAGAGLPGDGGSVAMVRESASVKNEGQKDREDTAVVDSELNQRRVTYSKTSH